MTKEERAKREQALLQAALNLFTTESWDDVSVAKIARLADVAKGTVYLHFASKDEICARLALDFYDELQQKCNEGHGTGFQQLEQLVDTLFTHYREQHRYKHVVQYCQREHFLKTISPELKLSLLDVAQHRRKRIADVLDQGVRDHSFAADAKDKLTGIYCTLQGALDTLFSNRITEHRSQMEFSGTVTNYILASVGHDSENKTTDTTLHTLDLLAEV